MRANASHRSEVYPGLIATPSGPSGFLSPLLSLVPAGLVLIYATGCGETPATVATPVADGPEPPAVESAVEPANVEPLVDPPAQEAAEPPKLPEPEGATRLSPTYEIWVHKERGEVIIGGVVSQRAALLEMFACTKNTKEHESIISANTQAFAAHAALLSLGAMPGHPVRWKQDTYEPPTGAVIEIEVQWRGKDGKLKQARAQEWVRDARTGEAMKQDWVFAGSGLWKDEETGEEHYMAEGGDFICVSNFSSAMLDVPAESTQANDGLLFEAFTDRIPPLGTPVRMVLRPKAEKGGKSGEE